MLSAIVTVLEIHAVSRCYGARTSGRSPWGETPRVADSAAGAGGRLSRASDRKTLASRACQSHTLLWAELRPPIPPPDNPYVSGISRIHA